jgi:hypothetical protein
LSHLLYASDAKEIDVGDGVGVRVGVRVGAEVFVACGVDVRAGASVLVG